MLVPPIEREGRYVFEFGSTRLEVDPRVGARVVSLSCAGTELLTGPDVDPLNYGSTFWPSPQAAWEWPPIEEIDAGPYSGGVSGSSLTLRSEVGTRNGLAIRVGKRFTPNLQREAIEIEYSIQNAGTVFRQFAPWEITRVFPNGLTFYPTGGAPVGNGLPLLATIEAAGHTWFRYASDAITANQKLFADGAGGWLAHVGHDVLLVKTFADTPAAKQAPGEAEIEIYANAAKTYVEVEQQGAYTGLEPGQVMTWLVTWYVRKLPPTLVPEVGSTDLLAFVTKTIE